MTIDTRNADQDTADTLLPHLYDELRRLARTWLARERPGHTLSATALVHESYLRLVGDVPARFENVRHLFGAVARAMRRILVERARRTARCKHGGDHERLQLEEEPPAVQRSREIVALDDALRRLATVDARKVEVVTLKWFGGLDNKSIASVLGVSERTVKRDWEMARAYLRCELEGWSER